MKDAVPRLEVSHSTTQVHTSSMADEKYKALVVCMIGSSDFLGSWNAVPTEYIHIRSLVDGLHKALIMGPIGWIGVMRR